MGFLKGFPTAEKGGLVLAQATRGLAGFGGLLRWVAALTRLTDAAFGLVGVEAQAPAFITLGLVAMLEALDAEVGQVEEQISQVFSTQPDQHIFSSLPRSGRVRAASLPAEIGDCR